MAWDSTRTVPWQRMMREWVIYVGIMAVILAVFFRDGGIIAALGGLLVSGPLYLLFGFVMAKFGYQRKSLKELRTAQADSKASDATGDDTDSGDGASRHRPAPTKRTSGGGNRPPSKSKSRRR